MEWQPLGQQFWITPRKWVESFLKGRTQQVRVGQEHSSNRDVVSGILLGPILFTIFINDLRDCVKCCCNIFVDDTEIYDITEYHDHIQIAK